MMADEFLFADGMGSYTPTEHSAITEFTGDRWVSLGGSAIKLEDRGDGRAWMIKPAAQVGAGLRSGTIKGSPSTFSFCFMLQVASTLSYHQIFYKLLGGSYACGLIGQLTNGTLVYSTGSNANENDGTIYNSVVLASSALAGGSLHHVELRLTLGNGTSGSAQWYIDGQLDTENTACDTVAQSAYMSQFIAQPKTGSDTTWGTRAGLESGCKLGDTIIHTFTPPLGQIAEYFKPGTADTSDSDPTPSTGTDQYAVMDEIGPNDATDFTEFDGSSGQRVGVTTGSVSSVTPLAVASVLRSTKADVGDAFMLLGVKHAGGAEAQTAAKAVASSYGYLVGDYETVDPETAAAWTLANANAAEVTAEVV